MVDQSKVDQNRVEIEVSQPKVDGDDCGALSMVGGIESQGRSAMVVMVEFLWLLRRWRIGQRAPMIKVE